MNGGKTKLQNDEQIDLVFRPAASLAFWCCLTVAVSVFAVLALSPKLRTYRDLAGAYDGLERTLVAAERKVESLQKMADALECDPEFAEELARVDFDASAPDEERIPVDSKFSLGRKDPVNALLASRGTPHEEPSPADDARTKEVGSSFVRRLLDSSLIDRLSTDRTLRGWLLGLSCSLLLVAFTFLCETGSVKADGERISWTTRSRRFLMDRYTKAGT